MPDVAACVAGPDAGLLGSGWSCLVPVIECGKGMCGWGDTKAAASAALLGRGGGRGGGVRACVLARARARVCVWLVCGGGGGRPEAVRLTGSEQCRDLAVSPDSDKPCECEGRPGGGDS